MNSYYHGKPINSGRTSISSKTHKVIIGLEKKGYFQGANLILDYGAGHYAKNADYLRKLGYSVYAYDKYNGKLCDGWKIGNVSNKLPTDIHFDIAYSSYVLNVVQKWEQDNILKLINEISDKSFHITRNLDMLQLKDKGNIYSGVMTTKGFQRLPIDADITRYGYMIGKEKETHYKTFFRN